MENVLGKLVPKLGLFLFGFDISSYDWSTLKSIIQALFGLLNKNILFHFL